MSENGYFADRLDKQQIELGNDFAPKFGDDGTIPCITTDADSGEVLMFAFMNKQSLSLTLETGFVHYWSRSRSSLWKKGESSGNMQELVEMRTDCDQDVVMVRVKMGGVGASCHQGYKSCFYRSVEVSEDGAKLTFNEDKPLFNPEDVY